MATLRVVSYAINGRGLGHLTRQLAILRQIRRVTALLDLPVECWVLTSSEADTLAQREGIPALKMPSKAMLRDAGIEPARALAVARTWVVNAVAGLQPDLLLVDTFPAGSFGELAPVLEFARRRVLVARRVKEEFAADPLYSALLPLFHGTVVPDERGTGPILLRSRSELLPREAARRALGVPDGARAVYVSLGGGGDPTLPSALPRLVDSLRDRGWHVVVGAGPLYVGEERRGPGITWLSRYVPVELFAGLDAAVSAAGYNSFHELMHAGVPTVFLPQPRIADDQAERARRAEAAGAGRVAARIEDVPTLLDAVGSSEAAAALVPRNGALGAAIAALDGLIGRDDLALASATLTDEVGALLEPLARDGGGLAGSRRALRLLRLLAGGVPADQARRRSALADLEDRGIAVPAEGSPGPSTAQELLRRYVQAADASQVPIETSILLGEGLSKKFPAARGPDLLDAVELLFPCWARFDDWMGAIALLRALPVQRQLPLSAFARSANVWLGTQEDLFDAVRDFTRLEEAGKRSASQVLDLLMFGEVRL